MFNEYRFDHRKIGPLVAEKQAALKVNKGLSDLLGYGLGVIERRLKKDPARYLDYGPYWWALKDVLSRAGREYGPESDTQLVRAYRGQSDLQTMVMADQFRTEFLAQNMVGTSKFQLSTEGGDYILFDMDMALRMAK
jgi:hypothetical protein